MMVRVLLRLSLFAVLAGWPLGADSAMAQAIAPQSDVAITGEYGAFLPPNISVHGGRIDQLIHVIHWFMAALFFGWGAFFVYCLVRFRRRTGHKADSKLIAAKPTKYLEIGVAAFEAVLLLGFSVPIWASVKNDLPKDEENPVRVRVLAEQFAWNFHYPGPDGVFGKTGPQHIDTAINPVGLDPNDPAGRDDVTSGELHFPVNRPVIAEIGSKDVIHSFSVPVLRIKQDAIPGMRIPSWFEANATGTYEVACAQLCGNNHYSMRAIMVVEESDESFLAWLESQRPEEFDEDELDD